MDEYGYLGLGKGVLLVALGVGYFVLLAALKEKKKIKLLGQVISAVIIILSVLGLWCYALQCYQTVQGGAACPFSGKSMAPVSK